MLNTFPQLLDFGFFAPTLLRVAAACVFLYVAWFHFKHPKETSGELVLLGRESASWVRRVFILIELAVAVGLCIGYYTQVSALLGCIICFKFLWVSRRLQHVTPLSRIAYILLGVICFSLLLSGAGAHAFDVRL